MKFSELSSIPFVHLYAGDLPDMPVYRNKLKIGLSLYRDDEWHIRHDVTNPLPLSDESVDIYQSEDVFEHIEYEKLPAIIQEIHRMLKKGGLFRLSLPDYSCDILCNRTICDSEGNFLFDPFGGGAYRKRYLFWGKKIVVNGGHVWFPKYESVYKLLEHTPFSSIEFLHYYDENGVPHTKVIDYEKGFIKRTPDNDKRVSSP